MLKSKSAVFTAFLLAAQFASAGGVIIEKHSIPLFEHTSNAAVMLEKNVDNSAPKLEGILVPDSKLAGVIVPDRGGIKLLSGIIVPDRKLAGVMIPDRKLAGGMIVDRYGRNV